MNERHNQSRKMGRKVLAGALGITGALLVGTMPAEALMGPTQVCSPGPKPSITVADTTGNEKNGSVAVEVTLSNKACWYVTVQYSVQHVSTNDQDFLPGTNKLTIKPGQTKGTITIPVVNDGEGEGLEQFVVALSNPSGGNIVDGSALVGLDDGPIPG